MIGQPNSQSGHKKADEVDIGSPSKYHYDYYYLQYFLLPTGTRHADGSRGYHEQATWQQPSH